MKTLDFGNDQTRLDVIEAIVKNSTHFTCGNVSYRREEHRVFVFEAKHPEMYSIEIVIELSAFSLYAEFNSETGKVELAVW